MSKRIYKDPPADQRCTETIRLKDGTTAQCGRRKCEGDKCWQHKGKGERA